MLAVSEICRYNTRKKIIAQIKQTAKCNNSRQILGKFQKVHIIKDIETHRDHGDIQKPWRHTESPETHKVTQRRKESTETQGIHGVTRRHTDTTDTHGNYGDTRKPRILRTLRFDNTVDAKVLEVIPVQQQTCHSLHSSLYLI